MGYYRHQRARLKMAVLLFVGGLMQTGWAQEAQPQTSEDPQAQLRDQCFEAHRSAQELKREGHFIEAQEHLLVCSEAACPGAIIEDCGAWMADLETLTPSMVFQVSVDGKDAPSAKIFVDGQPVDNVAAGVPVNPGTHTVRATVDGLLPLTQKVTLPAGQRMRLITFNFEKNEKAPAAESVLPADEFVRPVPIAVYPLLGLGVAGLASFGVLSSLGRVEQDHLDESCAPNCTDHEMSKMKTMYLIGDISAGVGGAALVAAGIVYLARPKKPKRAPTVSLAVDPRSGHFGVTASGRF